MRSLRAHFLAPVHTTVPVDFLHTDIVYNLFSGICQVGRSLAHSLLHRILLSLLVQVQPSTSLTWTPSGKRFGITFLLLLAFPADSFYNSLALSNSAPFFRLWGCLAHFLLHHNLLTFFLERTFLVILSCGAMSFNSSSSCCCFHRCSHKGESSTRIQLSFSVHVSQDRTSSINYKVY